MNQPPQTEKQTGKRIVSKGAYAANLFNKACAYAVGVCGFLMGLFCLASTGVLFHELRGGIYLSQIPLFVFCVVTMASGFWFLFSRSMQVFRDANKIDPGIPIHRANTAHLPAPESLVRASAEPFMLPDEAQAVLLRAATESVERHEEQLVRPTGEQELL